MLDVVAYINCCENLLKCKSPLKKLHVCIYQYLCKYIKDILFFELVQPMPVIREFALSLVEINRIEGFIASF